MTLSAVRPRGPKGQGSTTLTAHALDRDLKRFRLFRFLSTSYFFLPVLVKFFQGRGLDFTQIALLNSVYAATAVLFEVPTGVLADRFGRRRAMVLGSLLMAFGCLVDAWGHGFWTFALGEGLLALGMTLSSGADSAYLYDLLRSTGQEHLYRKMEGSATASKLVGAAGALLLGGLLGSHHTDDTYVATAVICTLAALVASSLGERPFARSYGGFWPQMRDAARGVAVLRPLRFAVGFSVLIFVLLRMGLYMHPAYLDAAGLDVAYTGAAMAVLSMVGAFGALKIEKVRRVLGESSLIWGLPLTLAVTYFVLGRWFRFWGIALLSVQSLVNGIYSPLSKELLNREIAHSGQRATVLSVESMARRLAFGAFAPMAGLVIDKRGLHSGFYVCALGGFVGGVGLLIYSVWRRRRGLSGFEGEVASTEVEPVLYTERPSRSLAMPEP
jgi:MFS family permease